MKKYLFAVLAVMLFAGRGYCEEAMPMAKSFGGMVAGGSSAKMTVEAVDKETRNVTLKDEAGEVSVVKCGPDVRNFDQIAVGDTLTLDLAQAVTIIVSDMQMDPTRTDSVEVERAPLGEKPAGTITSTIDAIGTVEDVDPIARTVTVKGPMRTVVIKADESAVNFEQVKKGDTVNLHVVETLAIAITK